MAREGPTVLWSMLKGKKVKSNDGKDVGEIKEISQNFLRIEKGTVEQYAKDFETFKTTPYGQKAHYRPDYDQNIRVIEDYKNIRDLK